MTSFFFLFFIMAGCSAFRSGVSTCLPGCWPPDSGTEWLPTTNHSARPRLEESLHCLPRIDPATALLLSAFLCCIDVFSNDSHAQCRLMFTLLDSHKHFRKFVTHSAFSAFARAIFYSSSLNGHLILSLTLFLYSCSPSWVV